jgi:hypothetical protein
MTELMRDDALELVAGEHGHTSARHADGRIAGGMAGGKRVDAGLVIHDVDLRDGNAGSDRHLLDDIEELPFVEINRVRVDEAAIQQLRHRAATAGKGHGFPDAPDRNYGQGRGG